MALADSQVFHRSLMKISRCRVRVKVLKFREHASWTLASDILEFISLENLENLENIRGRFREPLPWIGLDPLPDQVCGYNYPGRCLRR